MRGRPARKGAEDGPAGPARPDPAAPAPRRAGGSAVVALLAAAAMPAWTAGCKDKIGDSCRVNVDCATDGTRICDRSSPGGYCTIEGCVGGSCPKEAVCVAFYPTAFLTVPCSPDTEDLACAGCDPQAAEADCNAFCDPDDPLNACDPCDPEAGDPDCNARCDPGPATDDCLPEERCIGTGMCAPRRTERRYCMRKCSKGSDCRSKYECRSTGTGGAELAPKEGEPYPHTERRFCAPQT